MGFGALELAMILVPIAAFACGLYVGHGRGLREGRREGEASRPARVKEPDRSAPKELRRPSRAKDTGARILVVDGDAAFAAELDRELTQLGCVVDIVGDGDAGLARAASAPPDLILVSIELPHTSGYSVCNRLKKDPQLGSIPLVIMSSESTEETFEQHRKLRTHADDYVRKPIAFGELVARLKPFLPADLTPSASRSPASPR